MWGEMAKAHAGRVLPAFQEPAPAPEEGIHAPGKGSSTVLGTPQAVGWKAFLGNTPDSWVESFPLEYPRLLGGKLSSGMTGENRGTLSAWGCVSSCFLLKMHRVQ